ncbi:MAG: leucine-rich repeat domain-containing protein [Clostridia bacterium]|nr:leucine-rich repeat domain-containing protein [Clostridia bacterium]
MNSSVVTFINGFLSKFLSVLMSVLLSLGVLGVEKRGDNDEPADPSKPYVFETEDEYFRYYDRCLWYDLSGTEPFTGFDPDDEDVEWYEDETDDEAEPDWLDDLYEEVEPVLEKEINYEGFRVCLCKNGTAAITGITKAARTMRFPSSVEGYPVVAITNPYYGEFDDCLTFCTSIIIPNSVEYIGLRIFDRSNFLQNIDFGDRVRFIDGSCDSCRTLKSVKIPGSVESVRAFDESPALKDLEICRGVKTVGGFNGCTALETVRLPDTVETIGLSTFCDCSALRDIYIPASVSLIEGYVLTGCSDNLTVHGVAGSYAEAWAAENGVAFAADY